MKRILVSIAAFLLAAGWSSAQEQQADVQLKEVVVTATKTEKDPKDVTQSVTVITAEEIKRSGATTATEVLNGTVGAALTNYGPAGSLNTMRIRGADYSRVLILLDGIRLNSPRDLGFDLSALPIDVSEIERIEIVRGPASALYGSEAVGGVVNIITRKPEKHELTINGAIGTHGYDSSTLGFGNNRGSYYYRLDGSRTTSDGFRPNSDLEQWTYGGKIGFKIALGADLYFHGNYANKENGAPGPKGSSSMTDRQWDRMLVAGAGLTIRSQDGVTLRMRGSRTDETLQYRSAFGFSRHESYTDAAEGQADMLLGSWNALTAGYEMRRDHLDSTDTGAHVSDLKALFIQDEISLGDSLIVVAGARRDDHSQYGRQTSPKVSARYLMHGSGTIIRASYGESFRSPTPNDLYSPYMFCPAVFCGTDVETVGNAGLKPETSRESEVGLEQPLGDGSHVKLAGFSRKAENMIVWLMTNPTPTVEHWQPENIGNATVRGYEAEARVALAGSVRLDVNYTYTNPVDESTGLKIPFISKTQWKGAIAVDVLKGTSLYLEGRSVENYVNSSDPEWKYSVCDVKIARKVGSEDALNGDIFVAMSNVFDRKYEVTRNYPMPPREVKGGVTIRF